MIRSILATLLLATGVLGGPARAIADDKPAEPTLVGTEWRVECANSGKALDCQVVHRILRKDDRQLVASLAVRLGPDGKHSTAVAQIPLGVALSDPIEWKADDEKPEKLALETCLPQGCIASAPLSVAAVDALRKGKQVTLSFKGQDKQPITMSVPLIGFAIAYDRVK